MPLQPRPGEWTASANSLGEFVFEVAADGGSVTVISFHFKQFLCGNSPDETKWIHGDWEPDRNQTARIIQRTFTVRPQISGPYQLTFGGATDLSFVDEITIDGQFDVTGTQANGTWRVVWKGAVCSGQWTSPKKAVVSTASAKETTPVAPFRVGGGFTDSFNDNLHQWFVGDYFDPFVSGSRAIRKGKYRWEIQSYRPSRFSSIPRMDPIADFYLIADVRRVSGTTGSMYGLLFRRLDRNNFYLFQITDDQYYDFELLDQDEYHPVIDWTKTSAVHPGEVNQLAVRGEGSHFEFFINQEFVGQADNDEFRSGIAGLVIGFPEGMENGTFEFDNFEFGPLPPTR